jgi:putative heme iron utilization protein
MNVREQIASQNSATLATLSQRHEGYPFGSLVPYDIDSEGRPVIYISSIAEHHKNLSVNSQASLTVRDPLGLDAPQAHWRITILCDFLPVPASEIENYQKSYEARFPDSAQFKSTHDFFLFRGEIKSIRWIAGFSSMGWLTAEEYAGGI